MSKILVNGVITVGNFGDVYGYIADMIDWIYDFLVFIYVDMVVC